MARAFLDVQSERLGQTLSADQQVRRSRILSELTPIEKRIATLVGRADLTDEEPTTPAELAAVSAGDEYKPYARPHYWSAFILIGEPE